GIECKKRISTSRNRNRQFLRGCLNARIEDIRCHESTRLLRLARPRLWRGSLMRCRLFALALLLCVRAAAAQERIPDDHAKMIAKPLVEASAKVKGPLTVDVDADKPYAKRKDDHGALVLPATKLTAELITKAGKDIVPIGLLYVRELSLIREDKP